MADPRLSDVEELLQASIFHPSPCRRLRERVLTNAVQAKHREKVGRQIALATAAVVATTLAACVVGRFFVSGPADATPASATSTSTEDKIERDVADPGLDGPRSSGDVPSSGPSFGESLFRVGPNQPRQ